MNFNKKELTTIMYVLQNYKYHGYLNCDEFILIDNLVVRIRDYIFEESKLNYKEYNIGGTDSQDA